MMVRAVVHECILEHEEHSMLKLYITLDGLVEEVDEEMTTSSPHRPCLTPVSMFLLMVERSIGLHDDHTHHRH